VASVAASAQLNARRGAEGFVLQRLAVLPPLVVSPFRDQSLTTGTFFADPKRRGEQLMRTDPLSPLGSLQVAE
jgi:hypothetical protein